MQPAPNSDVDAELNQFDVALRQLKVQYDMFFAGALPREPVELRARVERQIKLRTHSPFRKYADRFRFNSLVGRFTALSELWTKTVRSQEEGERKAPSAVDQLGLKEHLLTRCRVDDVSTERKTLERLHARYVEARRLAGQRDAAPSLDAFMRGIDRQMRRLRDAGGCGQMELRLVRKDDKVQLKARPAR